MLTAIEIKNFKSAEKLNLDFARVNVFIGENGSGKSNILEAITFAAAAQSDKLDIEFLENRGIRVPSAKFMRSSFNEDTVDEPIEIKITVGDKGSSRLYTINNTNETYAQWQLATDTVFENADLLRVVSDYRARNQEIDKDKFDEKIIQLNKYILEAITREESRSEIGQGLVTSSKLSPLKSFVIYSPQNKQLRNLTEEGSIRPVGIHGEGLFKLLREIHAKQPDALADIDAGLRLIGWYKSMDLDNEPELPEDELFIQDKYLSSAFTQRSANEGFLYVLFYMALIVSKDTPQIFAIDNIDAALNPKLCAKI
ncbi:MAG: putative ATPase, partial [Phenylobacterium sp.]